MILGGRLYEQSAIALVSDTIIHQESVGDGVFWLFSGSRLGTGVSGSFRSRLDGEGSTT